MLEFLFGDKEKEAIEINKKEEPFRKLKLEHVKPLEETKKIFKDKDNYNQFSENNPYVTNNSNYNNEYYQVDPIDPRDFIINSANSQNSYQQQSSNNTTESFLGIDGYTYEVRQDGNIYRPSGSIAGKKYGGEYIDFDGNNLKY